MKVSARGAHKTALRLRQSRTVSRESTPREKRQECASQYSSSSPQSQKNSFYSEEPSSLEQFAFPRNGPAVAWTGSRRLLLGVLQDALRLLFQYRFSHTRAGKRIFYETQTWLWSSKRQWLYSFENVCAHLDLDPAYLRRGLQQFLQETEPSPARKGADISSPSAKPRRRPFRLIAGPGSRAPSRSQHPTLRKSAKHIKVEKRVKASEAPGNGGVSRVK
jgi:hypothetical protein